MTEEERRFKIEKLEKYSEERRESKDHIENMFLIGTLSLAAIVEGIGNYAELWHIPNSYAQYFLEFSTLSLVGMGVPIAIASIKELIKAIAEKTNIEKRIDEINEELDLLDQQKEYKSRGGR